MIQQQLESLEQRAADALEALRHSRAKLQELETRFTESEAVRLELAEENRELDEQNRELEEDNTRLRERLRSGEPAPALPTSNRRAQGLAALMGQRPRERVAPHAEPEPAPQTAPAQAEEQGQAAPSADALLKQWYQRYPKAFFKGHTQPLQVGIHQALAAREPWPEKLLRRALAGYVNLPRYLKAVREGVERIDLEGRPAGSVDAQAAEYAKRKLEQLQSAQRERGQKKQGGDKRGGGKPKGDPGTSVPTSAKTARPQQEARGKQTAKAGPATAPAKPMTLQEKLAALQAKHGDKR